MCACVLASATAHAGVAFFSNSSGNGYISTVAALAPLNGTNTLVKLSTPKGGKYIITYSAECGATASSGTSGWNAVEVLVDGASVGGLSTGAAFCNVNTVDPTNYNWLRGSVNVGVSLAVGVHTVQVRSTPVGGATTVWLGDSTLTVAF